MEHGSLAILPAAVNMTRAGQASASRGAASMQQRRQHRLQQVTPTVGCLTGCHQLRRLPPTRTANLPIMFGKFFTNYVLFNFEDLDTNSSGK